MAGPDKNNPDPSANDDDESPFAQPVVLPLADSIDLHPFQPQEISSVVEEYINQCAQAGLCRLRIIHGKGLGVQRSAVRLALGKHPAVSSYQDAPAEAGSWGATIVTLKRES